MNAPADPVQAGAPVAGVPPWAVAFLPRGVRLADDRVRGLRVLLGPERAIQLDPIGDAILSELDGTRSIGAVAANLAARFEAPEAQVLDDVSTFLADLVDRRLVFLRMVQGGESA